MHHCNVIPWEKLSSSDKVCCFITYASVFNDVIERSELIRRLGATDCEVAELTIRTLIQQGVIIEDQGFLTVSDLRKKISEKPDDFVLAETLIARKLRLLRFIGRLPFIDFIGISGSLAARNPVSSDDRKADVDVFIITSNHCIWLVGIFAALHRLFSGGSGRLCFNHIWDGSDMEVCNQNFYVATEIYNLIPVSGTRTYHQFLQVNDWAAGYFPALNSTVGTTRRTGGLSWFNKVFYLLFMFFRCIKNFSFLPLRELNFMSNDFRQISLKRRGAENGGYQQLVQRRFVENLKTYFPEMDHEMIEASLFPDELGIKIRSSPEFDFCSHSGARLRNGWAINYAKYDKRNNLDSPKDALAG